LEFDLAPQFSPDGKRIVFTRFGFDDQGNETSELHVVNLDGTHDTPLAAAADSKPRRRELVTGRKDQPMGPSVKGLVSRLWS
jgi:hypothetical protein